MPCPSPGDLPNPGVEPTSPALQAVSCIGRQVLYLDQRAKRSYQRPRGATLCPRSGAEAGRTPCPKGGGQEESPHVGGQGQRPRVPDCDGAGMAERSYPASEVGGGGSREELPHAPKPEARGSGWEELPHAPMPKARGRGREEKPHARGKGWWPVGPTPRPRSHGCGGAGGPRGAIPR